VGVAIGQIVIGLIEALFGRRLYWVFVALGGFAVGWGLASWVLHDVATWVWVLIGAAAGIVFALLSLKFTRFIVAVAGFFAVGAITIELARWLGAEVANGSSSYWITYAVGGAIGFLVILALFDWALIVLTSLAGAGATATGINYFVPNEPRWAQVTIWVAVFAIGVYVQSRSLPRRRVAGR
jgi:hypothetical protein